MGPVAIIAGIGVGVMAVGTYVGYKQKQKQIKYQKQAIKAQRAQDNLRAARERREAIRNARISSANVLQSSVNQGVQDSSAALGGLGSIETQLNQGLSFLDQTNRHADQATEALGKANVAGMKAGIAADIAGLGQAVFSNASGIAGVFRGG